jgi:hypothetical protein
MFRCVVILVCSIAAGLTLAGTAAAGGGNYVFDGGTPAEQAQVRAALNASSFDWSLVTAQITIHVFHGIPSSQASQGQIWLDADLLDSGKFSWGTVQHEYAHQVDFFLLDDAKRALLEQQLHGSDWCYSVPLPHSGYGCERFASTLAWTFWQSPDNTLKPHSSSDESAAMAPAQFRVLLAQLLATTDPSVAPIAAVAKAPALTPKRTPKLKRA